MCYRSAYFQQIEEDVQKHSRTIMEIKAAMNSFHTKDMSELIRFHKYVEQHLEKLTDETQVTCTSNINLTLIFYLILTNLCMVGL